MNELLKKIDKNIDDAKNKNDFKFDITSLISYIIEKINQDVTSEDSISGLESILKNLLMNNFDSTVKIFCYYIISNFKEKFSKNFFSSISKPLASDSIDLDKFDININALRNFIILNQKELIENISKVENLFKTQQYDINFIVNAFYFSNYPILLLNIINKLSSEDLRQFKNFLANFYLELGKLLFFNKLQDGSFLNLIKMISRILRNFKCYPELSTKQKICNSALIPLAEYLIINLEELINLIISFDIKLLAQSINFPIELYKIYNYYRDYNNPYKKREKIFHLYISYLFKETRNIVDPDIYSEVTKALCEFKIIEHLINPGCYSVEIVENISKFMTFSEHLDKTMWFDNNMKNLSYIINYIENNEIIELAILLLRESQYINNHNDRVITLYNLFNRLISLSLDYGNFVDKESLIFLLLKNNWFTNFINIKKLEFEHYNNWRNDIFICLIESIFHAKKIMLKNRKINEYINLIKICQDIIELGMIILDWESEGEAIEIYFLLLEDICIFYNDNFFNYIFKQNPKYIDMKEKYENILEEIFKKFKDKITWEEILLSREDSKYSLLLILSKYFPLDKINDLNCILNNIFGHLKENRFNSKKIFSYAKLLKCLLLFGISSDISIKDKIIIEISKFKESLLILKDEEEDNKQLISDIILLTEKMINYLYKIRNKDPLVLSNKVIEKIDNEYYLVENDNINSNLKKISNMNSLLLMNITYNSYNVIEVNSVENSSIYLEYFKKYFYYPLLEYNNDHCYILIDSKKKYIMTEWILISGISDPIVIYYRYDTNIEERETEIYIKCYNATNILLNNISLKVFLNENLSVINNENIENLHENNNGIEYKVEILSPYSSYEFSIKFYTKIFDVNYISIEAQFEFNSSQKSEFLMKSEPFYISLFTFLIPDNYPLYETSKFDLFYNNLNYIFNIKCNMNESPDNIIKSINNKFALIEYNNNNKIFNKETDSIKQIIKNKFPEYYKNIKESEKNSDNQKYIDSKEKCLFKIKLSSYCVFNFWVYIFIIGEYDYENCQSILNINIKSNDLKGLIAIEMDKDRFIKELFNNKAISQFDK